MALFASGFEPNQRQLQIVGVGPSQVLAGGGDSAHLVCALGVGNDCFLLGNIGVVASA